LQRARILGERNSQKINPAFYSKRTHHNIMYEIIAA